MSSGPHGIGLKLVQHKIDTGSQGPVRQPLRQTPIHYRQEASKELDKILKAGIVEESKRGLPTEPARQLNQV